VKDNGSDRKAFQALSGAENPQFLEDGLKIYIYLRKKYPENTNTDLDNILNGLCAALTCLMAQHIDRDDSRQFLQLIHKILSSNI
jgi:hypothetical protein